MGRLLRVVGVLVILGSCWRIAAMVAGNFVERPRQLRLLQLGLQILETAVSYANASLPEALETVARRVDPPISGGFSRRRPAASSLVMAGLLAMPGTLL